MVNKDYDVGLITGYMNKIKKTIRNEVEEREDGNIENAEQKFNTFLNYLEKEKSNLAIIMAIKDTPGSKLSPEILVRLQMLGFHTFYTELWRMYIGIIDKGQTILDLRAPEKEDTIRYSCNLDGHDLEIHSSSWRRENYASIMIDKIEYAVNMRGINLVAYNYATGEVCASVAYDGHTDQSYFKKESLQRQKIAHEWLSKKKHYDVMLMCGYNGTNYGSLINAYAEYVVLKKMGKSVLMLSTLAHIPEERAFDKNLHSVKFFHKYYCKEELSPIFKVREMEQLNDFIEVFATGSDQLWKWPISNEGTMYQNFVHKDKKKISLGTSCGSMNDMVPSEKKEFVRECLIDFDAISVREEASSILLRKKYGIFSDIVLEPVFWIDRDTYATMLADSSIIIPTKNFVLAYILDPNNEKLEFLHQIERELGMDIITIPDGTYGIYGSAWDKENFICNYPNCKPHTEVVDLLKLFANASFVITDSFHGTCFSIIFQRKFISICNEERGKDRFDHLLKLFGLTERLIKCGELNYSKEYENDIDYAKIENIIKTERENTFRWIEKALNQSKKNNHVCKVKKECIGCGACASICPVDALEIVMGQYGYYQPKINVDKCIDCGKCKAVCPAIEKPVNNNTVIPELYECILKDKSELMKCSSGGAFPLIASRVFDNKGIVYGVAWGDAYRAEYRRIDTIERLHELQKSKYMQGYTGSIYRSVREDLENGLMVLFSGVPCHVAGLYKYLGKEYDNLITIDLLCGNSPSAEFFQQYLKEDCPVELDSYEFRTKDPRWEVDCLTLTLTCANGNKIVRHGTKEDVYQRAFHSHIMCPEHCEKCNYSEYPRIADFTIGDFWGIEKKDITIEFKDGVSVILVNNDKARKILSNLQNENVFLKKVPLDWLEGNGHTTNSNWASKGREAFYDAILEHSFVESLEIAEKVK